MTEYNPEEKIYLTYKTRMTTEARMRRIAFISNALLSWYSFCLIIISMIDLSKVFTLAYASLLSAIFATAVFGLSLFIYGQKLPERAEQFRSCYLQLKHLYESTIKSDLKMKKYSEILDQYENQSDADYDDMLFDAWFRNQNLRNASGPVNISCLSFCKVLLRRVLSTAVVGMLFLGPLIGSIFWIKPLVVH
jgi:hypothetical protein